GGTAAGRRRRDDVRSRAATGKTAPRNSPAHRRLHSLLDGDLSRSALAPAVARPQRPPPRLSGAGKTLVPHRQRIRRRAISSRSSRPAAVERRVRTVQRRVAAGAQRMGKADGRKTSRGKLLELGSALEAIARELVMRA